MVDDENFDWLNQWCWCVQIGKNNIYAIRNNSIDGEQKTISMHRQIMGVTDNCVDVDHRDGNGLNNQEDNLRACTRSQNLMNRKGARNSSSRFKCVYWNNTSVRWVAHITINGSPKCLGRYRNEEDAARRANQAFREYHGKFARYNDVSPMFPDCNQKKKCKTSEHRGVYFNKKRGLWVATISKNGRSKYLGSFTDEAEAAKKYIEASISMR